MKKAGSWLWGGVLVALGIILGINALGIAHINIFFPGWWTLFLIIPCGIGIFTEEHKGGQIAGFVLGVCLLLSCLGVLPFGILWKLLLPAILVIVGVAVMLRGSSNGEVQDKIRKAEKARKEARRERRHIVEAEVIEDDEDDDDDDEDERDPDFQEYWSTFSGQQINYDGKTFTGCRLDAVFGGADLDLRGAKIENEAVVKASSVFGGIIIYVPKDIKVEVANASIFGGVSDKRRDASRKKKAGDETKAKHNADNAGKTLYIDATCIFGGVEIR